MSYQYLAGLNNLTLEISGNPTGRPPGTPNRVNDEIRQRINDFLDDTFDTVKNDLMQLDAHSRTKFYIDLLQFGLPKLKTIEMDVTHENFIASIELSRDEIRSIAKELENDM